VKKNTDQTDQAQVACATMLTSSAPFSSNEPDTHRLARWLRALLSTLLCQPHSSGSSAAYDTALEHLQFIAHRLGKKEVAQMYPSDEKAWLLSTAWDAGIELYQCVSSARL
jgi:hypothetical protein